MIARFHVYGDPRPQGSKTAVKRGSRALVIDAGSSGSRQSLRAWRQAVASEARRWVEEQGGATFERRTPLQVTLDFHLRKPKSKPKRMVWSTVKPDVDKLARAVLDGLTDGGLLADDAQVALLHAVKQYAGDGEASGCVVDVQEVV